MIGLMTQNNSFNVENVIVSGKEVFPIVEGGKGVGVSNWRTSGAFAQAGAIGTFSGVNPKYVNEHGNEKRLIYKGVTRKERHNELIEYSIRAGISQAMMAHELSGGMGRIHMNMLWEAAATEEIMRGILQKANKDVQRIHGVTCGAGLPFKLAEIATDYNIYYYPIISSMKAFKILWIRRYSKGKYPEKLGGVVYEDPWLAGGHNGISNAEDPNSPQDPYDRIASIRKFMNSVGLQHIPIILAGGVWNLKEQEKFLHNDAIGKIAFQFGTRPLLTQESPISDAWKKKLMTLKKGDIILNQFSPTGFYSSAINNEFLQQLQARSEREVSFSTEITEKYSDEIKIGKRGRLIYVSCEDKIKCDKWIAQGYTEMLKTPDTSGIFVSPNEFDNIRKDQIDCMGCLSQCKFSNWKESGTFSTGKKPDPRSFCIQKTLQDVIWGENPEQELVFAGHNAYRFANDPLYQDNFIPTIQQLVDHILTSN